MIAVGNFILIACEESQRVCASFRDLGFTAFSADVQDPSGGHPEWHILGDVLPILHGGQFVTMDGAKHNVEKWDLIVAHPPCTYISNAGARWLFKSIDGRTYCEKERLEKGLIAREFFMQFYNASCAHIAIENPIPSSVYHLPKCTQVIQPYEFGHPYSKKTCLWLRGLPKLRPTEVLTEYKPYITSGTYSKTHDPKFKGESRKGGSSKSRSKTFPGIANAMAEQWGSYLKERMCDRCE